MVGRAHTLAMVNWASMYVCDVCLVRRTFDWTSGTLFRFPIQKTDSRPSFSLLMVTLGKQSTACRAQQTDSISSIKRRFSRSVRLGNEWFTYAVFHEKIRQTSHILTTFTIYAWALNSDKCCIDVLAQPCVQRHKLMSKCAWCFEQVCDQPHPKVAQGIVQECIDGNLRKAHTHLDGLWSKGYSAQDIIQVGFACRTLC